MGKLKTAIKATCKNCGQETIVRRQHMTPGAYAPRHRVNHVLLLEPPFFTLYCENCDSFTIFGPNNPLNTN
jgi:hypothetical protein